MIRGLGVKVLHGHPLVIQEQAARLDHIEDLTKDILKLGGCVGKVGGSNASCVLL
jgi:hypothetical protein